MHSQLLSVAHDLRRFLRESLESVPSQREPAFDRAALELFRIQYSLNPPYRSVCDARGLTPDKAAHWTDIPAVSTAAFKEFPFTCIQEARRSTYFESSGTTQATRSRQHHCPESLSLYEDSLKPWFRKHLLPETLGSQSHPEPGFEFLSLTPPREAVPHSSLVHMLEVVSRQTWFARSTFAGHTRSTVPAGGPPAWTLNREPLHDAVRAAHAAQRPLVLAGTAFNFVHLLDGLPDDGFPLPSGSRIMETGGYKGRSREMKGEELHRHLSRALHIPLNHIVTEYGMTELGSQGYSRVAGVDAPGRVLHFPPWTRVSVVSPETGNEVNEGETGVVRVVDLANAFSVIAVETEDIAFKRSKGIELLGRLEAAEPRGCSLMAAP